MDAEYIKVSAAPHVRSSPPSPSVEPAGVSPVAAGNSANIVPVAEGDTVTLSSRGPAEQQGAASVPAKQVSGGSSQARLEVTDKNEVVLKVIDSNTGQVIKEIPAREQQRLSKAIQESVDKLTNHK